MLSFFEEKKAKSFDENEKDEQKGPDQSPQSNKEYDQCDDNDLVDNILSISKSNSIISNTLLAPGYSPNDVQVTPRIKQNCCVAIAMDEDEHNCVDNDENKPEHLKLLDD